MNRNPNTQNPYSTANAAQRYPSQSEDYFSLRVGGAYTEAEQNAQQQRQEQQFKRQGAVPYFYQDVKGTGRGRGGGGAGDGFQRRPYNRQKNRNNYGGNFGAGNRWNHGGGGQFRQKINHQTQSKESTYSMYFHPTMLEDPWKDLLDRLQAIRKSEIEYEKVVESNVGSDTGGGGGGEVEEDPQVREDDHYDD